MPVIKSAKKKLKQDKKRTAINNKSRALLDNVLKKARKTPSVKTVTEAIKTADKAVKNHLIHKNKAARIKSALSKLIAGKTTQKATTTTKTTKSAKKKAK